MDEASASRLDAAPVDASAPIDATLVDAVVKAATKKRGETALFHCLIVLLVIRLFSHIYLYFIHLHRLSTIGNRVCIEGGLRGDWLQTQYGAYCIYFGNTYFGSVLTN